MLLAQEVIDLTPDRRKHGLFFPGQLVSQDDSLVAS